MNQQYQTENKRDMISDLSQARTFLMGCAIIWIVIYHIRKHIVFPNERMQVLFNIVAQFGYGGCDIFLFLSGFGLANSLKKNRDFAHYMGRRMKRILPAYIPFIFLYIGGLAFAGNIGFREALGNISFLGFWLDIDTQFNWYVQAIVGFYLLAPVIVWVYGKYNAQWKSSCLLLCSYLCLLILFIGRYQMVAISRLPVFAIGCCLAMYSKEKTVWDGRKVLACIAVLLAGVILLDRTMPYAAWENGWLWHPFALIAPTLSLVVAWLRPWWLKVKATYWLDRTVCLLGICSFEIYLVHNYVFQWVPHGVEGNVGWIMICGMCIAVGIGYHYLVDSITRGCWKTAVN